ncbi:head GIN domain-containing protein [Kordia algicida OT-1]|uniref:Lipoprotein, putative n=1 Tax=Kordia algicida OT-1 TaxID=391587 RepID=A9DXH9_9FLAO|nr:DUF2807 domain-containing protein [Kordia algicida]EDP96006.1 lipoprotein, putative [Kordia algicida OT-1]
MKHLYIFSTLLFLNFGVWAQNTSEIKGNRNLKKISIDLYETFQTVEIDDELEVTLRQGKENRYTLETDENLIGVIKFTVQNNILKIYTSQTITRSKKIDIELTVTDLQKIVLKNDAEIRSRNRLETEMLAIYAYNSSKADIEVETTKFTALMQHNATGKFEVRAETTELVMNGRTDMNADIKTDALMVTTQENAELKLDGSADLGEFTLMDASKIDAEHMKVSEISVSATKNTDAYVHATKNLKITAEGDSKIYVYGNPDLTVETFADKARIIKK